MVVVLVSICLSRWKNDRLLEEDTNCFEDISANEPIISSDGDFFLRRF
jgi:hypothetical protein